jgi:hypothetical protein
MWDFFKKNWAAIVTIGLTVLGLGGCLIKTGLDEYHKVEDGIRANRLESDRKAEAERQRQEAQIRRLVEEELAQPNLQFLSGEGPGKDKLTHLRYHNKSQTKNGIIYIIEFIVSDPAQLKIIERAHAKPKEPFAEASFDKNEVRLIHGSWHGDEYMFWVYPDCYVEADKPIDLATCIVDPALPNMVFQGRFEIEMKYGKADKLKDVRLWSKSK